ncbi:conserved hypothetical protein [Gloeothece citriformis PCC 7424]|uniref:Uncharacterized protein n=1 Tax=Gloeothece citriformis (strain PCC 7424) TaxID=65393 RepID=B7KCF0_GLOC7|nr:hypothetical protein [Gloeothece citriformis]ACK70255.1 conserved hypothetical protein [Gloeothece citriformis PCC 7424]
MTTNNSISFQKVVEYVEALSPEEQDLLFSLIQKRRIDERRTEIAANANETLKAWHQGRAKRGSVNDLRADLAQE